MYKILLGFTLTVCSEDAIEDMILENNIIINTINNIADPKNEAKNVLKNDFIVVKL